MRMRYLLSRAAIVAALFYGAAGSGYAGNITVTNTNDSGAGSLRQAIVDANDCDTISFAVTGTIGLTTGELLVDKDLTISGPGADILAVDGNAITRVFHIGTATTVRISGLTIRNGIASSQNYPDNSGGGIYNEHATLIVTDCAITGNFASVGGGINNDAFNPNHEDFKATLTINHTNFTNNCVDGKGAAVYNLAYFSLGKLTINNSSFSGNVAVDNGGAIGNVALDVPTQALTFVRNSTLRGNRAGGGGGLWNYSVFQGNAIVEVESTTIRGNSAQQGGGISNDSGISGSVEVDITNSTLSDNSGTHGGGVSNHSDDGNAVLQITNSTLSNNSATTGGGVHNEGASGLAFLDINNSTLSQNSAVDFGGGIYNSQVFTPALNIANTILSRGVAGENIYNVGMGRVISLGYNVSSDYGSGYLTGPGDQINTDPMLGSLQDNGGRTFTHELLKGSPAINAGDPHFMPPPQYDQRGAGFDRVVNDRLDVGSFEVQSAAPTPTPSVTPAPTPRQVPTPRSRPTSAPRPTPIHGSVTEDYGSRRG